MNIHHLEKHSPGDGFYDVRDQLKRHIYERSQQAFLAGDAARDALRTPQSLRRRQRAIRRFFIESLGRLPSADTPLNARKVGTVQGDGFLIEKIIFESRPRHFVTANLYLPQNRAGRTGAGSPAASPERSRGEARRGAVLFLCGHHAEAKHVPEYQSVCQTLVQTGLIVLAQDPIGQGERFSYWDARQKKAAVSCCCLEHDYAGVQCQLLGDGIARYFLHDAMRGVDYLCSRPEVDPRRIGVTGNSGGGTQTSMMMMADPRIAAAAPATFIMNRQTYQLTGGAQDAEQIWPGFTAAGFDHEDILLAMAPKPVRVLAVTYDFFPIEGTRRTVERCRRIWKLCGKADHLDLVEDASEHQYTPKLARAAADFFARHLLAKKPPAGPPPVVPFKSSKLWCTRSGQVQGEIKEAAFVHEANCQRLSEVEANRRAIPAQERRQRALRWLRRQIFRHRKPTALNPRIYPLEGMEELVVEAAVWWSQAGLLNHGMVFRASALQGRALPVSLAIWDGGTTALRAHERWIHAQCRRGRAVMVLNVSGAGALAPNPLLSGGAPLEEFYGTLHKFADDLIWLDDDLAALRAYDVIRSLDMIGKWPGLLAAGVRLYAHGRQGLYGQWAAALDRRVKILEVKEGIESFAGLIRSRYYNAWDVKSLMLRGVLNYFDLPDLRRWQRTTR